MFARSLKVQGSNGAVSTNKAALIFVPPGSVSDQTGLG